LVLAEAVYDHLLNAFVNQRRFEFFERQQLEAILREQKLIQTELVDPATAARIAKIMGVEGTLMVSVTETPQAVEIFARFVDVET
jgi:curli biogenesis system outer membrane secretion channel CsgG